MGVEFAKYGRGESTVVDYKTVPPIEFSECMRDVYTAATAAVKKEMDDVTERMQKKPQPS